MKEDISSHITQLIGPIEGAMMIQSLNSCNIQDDITILSTGINIPITSLRQLSDLNVHMEALRCVAKKMNKSESRAYPVKVDKQGNVFINLVKTTDNRSFSSWLLEFLACIP